MIKRLFALALALTFVLGAAGCGGGTGPSGTGLTVDSTGTLNLHLGGEPASIDPAFATSGAGGSYAVQLFEGLTTLDSRLAVAEGMAANWTIGENEDGLPLYTFTIREDAIWSDGQPVTADDFVYAWRRAINPATEADSAYLLYPIRNAREILEGVTTEKEDGTTETTHKDPGELGVFAVDEKTLEVVLEGPCAYFLQLLTLPIYFPVREETVSASPYGWTNAAISCMTNGPYMLREWNHDQNISMVANDNHWNYDAAAPQMLNFVLSEDEEAVYADFQAGRLLAASSFSPLEREAALAAGTLHVSPRLGTYYYLFNTEREAVQDAQVRKALSLAVNREALAETGNFGVLPGYGLVPYGVPDIGRGEDFRETSTDYFSGDYAAALAAAKALLAEAGFAGGAGLPALVFLTNDTPGHIAMAEEVARALKEELGVTMEVEALGWDDFQAAIEAGEWDLLRSGTLGVTRDAYAFLDTFLTDGPQNRGGFSNEEFDEALAASMAEQSATERIALLHQAEDILVDQEAALIPLTFYSQDILVSEKLQGVVYSAAGYQFFRWASVKA